MLFFLASIVVVLLLSQIYFLRTAVLELFRWIAFLVTKRDGLTDLLAGFDRASVAGRNCIITGANSGIGFEAAKSLALLGFNVVLACRSRERGEKAVADLRAVLPAQAGKVSFRQLDTSSLADVRRFATEWKASGEPLHLLINNAGVMGLGPEKSVDGFDIQFATNHLGHFLLTHLLLDTLKKSGSARIVNVSSLAHSFGWIFFSDPNLSRFHNRWLAYGQSKMAQMMCTFYLNRQLSGTDVRCVAVHPGSVRTGLWENLPPFLMLATRPISMIFKDPASGARPTVMAALLPDGAARGDVYIADCRRVPCSTRALDRDTQQKLWRMCCSMAEIQE